MGGGGGKSSTSTQSVSIPPEVLARYNAVNARAEGVAQQPFQQYGGEFVAPLNPTQQAGIQATSAASQLAQPYYGEAAQGLRAAQQGGANYIGAATNQLAGAQQQAQPYFGGATMAALAGGQAVDPGRLETGRYMNPYTQNVVGATQAAMGQQQGQQLAQQQSEAIRAGAFGGERAGLQRQTLRGQQGLAQAQAIAPLYQQGYQQALQTAQQQQGVDLGAQQANRAALQQMGQQLAGLGQQQFGMGQNVSQGLAGLGQQGYTMGAGSAQQLAGLGTGAQQAALQGAQAQIGAGTLAQQTQQAQDTAQYQQFLQQRGYDFQVAQFLANIAMGTGALSGSTTSTTQPRGFFSNRGGFKTGESLHRAGKAYGGGLDPNSMGGAVYEPGAFERGGYATAGSVVDSTDLAAILAQQRQSFGPFAAAGPYGQAAGATPHGPSGIVPQQQMHVPKLVTAGALPKQQSGAGSDLGKVYSLANEATTGLTGKGLTERAGEKMGLRDSPEKIAEAKGANMPGASANATTGNQNPSGGVMPSPPPRDPTATSGGEGLWDQFTGLFKSEGGGIMPRHHYADGGGEDSQADEAIPYDPSDVQGTKDPMEGVLKAGSQKPQMLKPAGGGGGGGGGGLGGDIAKGLAMAKTAASLFAMSDKRLKDNVRPVGKTFDGQNIYSYNLGDKPTQLGLIAQEVRSKNPDAVGHRGKYLTVNYDEATRHAANRGHFYEGGIVPRHGYQTAGTVEDLPIDAEIVERAPGLDPNVVSELRREEQRAPVIPQEAKGLASDPTLIRSESGGNWEAENKARGHGGMYGHFGRAQFGHARLQDAMNAGVVPEGTTPEQFMKNPDLQKATEAWHFGDISKFIADKGYDRLIGTKMNGIPVTEQGMINAAHLGGKGGLQRYLESGGQYNPDDKRKSLSDYMAMGAGMTGSDRSGQGLGSGRPPQDVGRPVEGKAAEPGFFDRNKGIILPVLQGIGAMASSKSISPFAAALQGLGAGAKAYGEEETRQAGIEQSKAQTFESAQRGSNLSFLRDGTLVRMPDGSLMLTVEAMKKGLIPLGGKIAGLAENSAASKYLQSIGINAPAATQYLKEPETKVPDLGPKPIDQSMDPNMTDRGIFGNSSRQLAQKDAYRTMGLTPAGAAQVSKDYETSTAAAGVAANQNTPIINSLAGNTSKIVNAQGLDAPGKTNEFRANIANGVNTLARSMGYKGEDVLSGDTNAAIQNKLNTFLASQSTEASGQHNLGALRTMLGAMANPDMPPQAQAKIASQIMTMTQKAKDRDAHREVFGDVSGGSFATAGQAFENDTKGRYEREERLLGALILKDPQAVEKLTTGTKSPQVIEQYFRNLSKATGVPYTPGLSRYFVSGVQ